MAAGEVHAYQIALEAGQLLRAVVNQRGIDVLVIVTGPDGKKSPKWTARMARTDRNPSASPPQFPAVTALEFC